MQEASIKKEVYCANAHFGPICTVYRRASSDVEPWLHHSHGCNVWFALFYRVIVLSCVRLVRVACSV
jgi:hypothetical protein